MTERDNLSRPAGGLPRRTGETVASLIVASIAPLDIYTHVVDKGVTHDTHTVGFMMHSGGDMTIQGITATATDIGRRIDVLEFDGPGDPGSNLELARVRGADFRKEFAATGTPTQVDTCDLVSLPYPTRFGLFRASRAVAPFLSITNRMLVIRWNDSDGRPRVLLFEPSDVELGRNTAYFAELTRRTPTMIGNRMVTEHGRVVDHLARLGIEPSEVDYLVFDHLHTQDLRRWVGTSTFQTDLGCRPPAIFPNAKVIVQRDELLAMSNLHPLQKPWYQAESYTDLNPNVFAPIDGSVLIGPGVALIKTPGHVFGNQSLVLNTSTGIWASSENVIAAECLTPEHSTMPGIARWSTRWQQEVVLNANTIETTAHQYNSVILEKAIVDRSQKDSRFLQFFPSSELTPTWTAPGTKPTFSHQSITHRA